MFVFEHLTEGTITGYIQIGDDIRVIWWPTQVVKMTNQISKWVSMKMMLSVDMEDTAACI